MQFREGRLIRANTRAGYRSGYIQADRQDIARRATAKSRIWQENIRSGVTCTGSTAAYPLHWILGRIPYPQFAERICGYPWILRMLPQSSTGGQRLIELGLGMIRSRSQYLGLGPDLAVFGLFLYR